MSGLFFTATGKSAYLFSPIRKPRLDKLSIRRGCAVIVWAVAIVVFMRGQALASGEPISNSDGYVPYEEYQEMGQDYLRGTYQGDFWAATQQPSHIWTIDYRFRAITSGRTAYEFGTSVPPPEGWAPLSRLDFRLNSTWHGIQVGYQKPLWGVRCEWLMPVEKSIKGNLHDFDWVPQEDSSWAPGDPFTDLGIAQERWIDGQMLNFEFNFRIWDEPFGFPVDIWPVLGFRWQRFDIMCFDALQVKEDNVWPTNPSFYPGDGLTFNQQYYIGYVGAQVRTTVNCPVIQSFEFTFQGDWGATGAYNVDHHLLREGDRYTMETTSGYTWHLSLTFEVPVKRFLSVGFETDFLQMHTNGTHRQLNLPENQDATWDNGVNVWSEQTWLTAFVRLRI